MRLYEDILYEILCDGRRMFTIFCLYLFLSVIIVYMTMSCSNRPHAMSVCVVHRG